MNQELGLSAASARDPEPRRFPCTQCGASLEYVPGATVLRCTHCGYENQITAVTTPIVEQDFRQALRMQANAAPTRESVAIHCDSCGASYTFDSATHAGLCPFCGAPVVAATQKYRQLPVQALLPFQIGRDQARAAFRQWLNKLWFAPNRLKDYARNDTSLAGMYVPYWTYDAETTTTYQGERGDDYQEQEIYRTIENGQEVERSRIVIKTRWMPVAGVVSRAFDDVLVLASQSLPQAVTERLEPWDLANLTPYQEEYLSGFRSEMYQVELDKGFDRAKEIMADTIRGDIARDIGGDHQRIEALDTRYGEVRFKHILLPVWMSAFRFRDKSYRFLVNGCTGEVQGERPYSRWKIAFAILLTALLLGGGIAVWQQYSATQNQYPAPRVQRQYRLLLDWPKSPSQAITLRWRNLTSSGSA